MLTVVRLVSVLTVSDEEAGSRPANPASDYSVRKKTEEPSEPGGSRTQALTGGGGSALLASAALTANLRSETSNRSHSSRNSGGYSTSSSPKERALHKVKAMGGGASSSGATKEESLSPATTVGYSSASNVPVVKH